MTQNTSSYRRTPGGFLAYIMRKLTLLLNVDHANLKILIERYIQVHESTTALKKNHSRINIFNEITKSEASIKVFFKTLAILRIKKVKFILVATTHLNEDIVVTEEFDLSKSEE